MPEISTSSTSPGFIHSGGLRRWPTPSGVPVAMTSPGCSVVKSEQKPTICWHGIDQHVGAGVLHLLAVEPRGQRERVGSGISSVVTIQGPSGPVPGKFLPEVTENFW